ncbi:hypothetical protein EJ04DRAFT_562931 [Polyplosphaeria fusca]|uniref:Uncharacterized protein n=1 Tax=Polyplosphaeria fusca TaxID=682080 RepID=A0A9P4R3W6_9PLEO|nr:hypothetical protein EJ04DRAFT_562931 [Polyplosphaeria fusca]
MDELDDELDFKHHHLKPDVYYRCPMSDSLDGALRNEIQRSSESLIPVEVCTEFRAIARCFVETIQTIDGFKYSERHAFNKEGTDGVRFKYVCADSFQNRYRKSNIKKEPNGTQNCVDGASKGNYRELPTYDCGGAVHIKFSTKRDAINIVYKHNPIRRDAESRTAEGENGDSSQPLTLEAPPPVANGKKKPGPGHVKKSPKRKRKKSDDVVESDSDDYVHADLDMSTSPERQTSAKNKRKKNDASASPATARKS